MISYVQTRPQVEAGELMAELDPDELEIADPAARSVCMQRSEELAMIEVLRKADEICAGRAGAGEDRFRVEARWSLWNWRRTGAERSCTRRSAARSYLSLYRQRRQVAEL